MGEGCVFFCMVENVGVRGLGIEYLGVFGVVVLV